MKTLRKLYFWAAIYTFVPIMIIALAMICFKSWMMLILIFGGLYVCGMVPRSVNLLKCARLMKSMDMLVLADKEYPNEGSLAYYISGHFVWGIENHSVVPLESIASVQIAGRNYVNSMKGKATLVLITFLVQSIIQVQ